MRISYMALSAALLGAPANVCGFVVPSPPFAAPRSRASTSSLRMVAETDEFDSILGEGSSYRDAANAMQSKDVRRRSSSMAPVIRVPDDSPAATVKMTASTVAATDVYGEADLGEEDEYLDEAGAPGATTSGMEEFDPIMSNNILRKQHEENLAKEQRKASGRGPMRYVKNPLLLIEGKDFSDVLLTVLIPGFCAYLAVKKGVEIGLKSMGDKTDDTLQSFAEEMVYHDGDVEEMEMCFKDYKKRLWYEGVPHYVRGIMLERYLSVFAKKVTVSPQSISTLSYVLSMMGMDEESAASSMVTTCRENPDNMSSAGKILFYGKRILKTPEARKRLDSIARMIAKSAGEYGEAVVEQSQKAMGEAAYRSAVAEAGKDQTSLTVGWEVLGLDKETATRIFDDAKDKGFKTSREEHYGTMNQKYDDKGRKIDESGELMEGEPEDVEEEEETSATGSVYECGECGYTLFIAKGRDFKFFSDSFTCPECGAPKDKFKAPEMDE